MDVSADILAQDDVPLPSDQSPLSHQEISRASDQGGSHPSEGDDDRDSSSPTGGDHHGGPLSDADDDGKVLLSFIQPVQPDAMPPIPVRLLHIPHEVIGLYSLKPRKWLLYVATIICGVQGKLRFINEDEDITEQGMEQGVDRGDHLVFRLSGETKFIDGYLRYRGHDQITVTSRSRVVPRDLRLIYGGCPFTKVAPSLCQACHLIPHVKGNDYLRRILAVLDEPHDDMTIDSHQNMLMMDVRVHIGFDNEKHVGFLKTPNEFLKTNEVPGGENADPEEYRVTVHCFSTDQQMRGDLSHMFHSDLRRGSGSRSPPPPVPNEDLSHRPMDILLDLVYVYYLLVQWGPKSAMKMLQEDTKRFYPKGMTERGEDRKGKGEAEAEEKARRTEENNKKPDERATKRSKSGNKNDRQVDENDREDFFDHVFAMACMSRGFLPEEFEAEEERRQREMEEREAARVAEWREGVDGQQPIECDEDAEHQYSCLGDDDDEKPVSVQEALSRTLP